MILPPFEPEGSKRAGPPKKIPKSSTVNLGCFLAKPKKPWSQILYFLGLLEVIDPSDDDGELRFFQKSTL